MVLAMEQKMLQKWFDWVLQLDINLMSGALSIGAEFPD